MRPLESLDKHEVSDLIKGNTDTKELRKNREKLYEVQKIEQETTPANHSDKDPKLQNPEELTGSYRAVLNQNNLIFGTQEKSQLLSAFIKNPTANIYQELEGDLIPEREEEFNKLKSLFQRYGLLNPNISPVVREGSLQEKQKFRHSIENIESHFQSLDNDLYSQNRIEKIVNKALLHSSPEQIYGKLKSLAKKEKNNFDKLTASTTLEGVKIAHISSASRKLYLEYYRTTTIDERPTLIKAWGKLAEHEFKLALRLRDCFKNDPEEFKLALANFQQLDFLSKERALKTIEAKTDKEIKETRAKKKKIEQGIANLPSSLQKKFKSRLKKAKTLKEITKLLEEIESQLPETEEKEEVTESKEEIASTPEAICKEAMLLLTDEPEQAFKLLKEFKKEHGPHAKITFMMKTALKYMQEFDLEEEKNEGPDLEALVEKKLKEAKIQEQLAEAELIAKNIAGIADAEKKHAGRKSAQARAQKEHRTTGIEQDLRNDFHQKNSTHILDKDGRAQEVLNINLGSKLSAAKLGKLQDATAEHDSDLQSKRGLNHLNMRNNSGRLIDSREARATQNERMERLVARSTSEIQVESTSEIDLRTIMRERVEKRA